MNTDTSYASNNIPIVFAVDNNYVPYMSAMMQSVMENANSDRHYCFIILYQDITELNQKLINEQIDTFKHFSIEFINVSDYFNSINLHTSRHVTVETYFRLLIPYLLADYDKVIYLDADMICCADISPLFDIDLENYLLAAVWDTDIARYYCSEDAEYIRSWHSVMPALKNPAAYFNGGLIVFNTKQFRQTISQDELFTLAASRKWNVHDQDILNYLCDSKTHLLHYHWNVMNSPRSACLPENLLQEFNDALKQPKIIHYKPWEREYYIPHFEYFWKYACRTPFINTIIEDMKQREFINNNSTKERFISGIIKRKGIGLKFILVDCLKAWLFRTKPIKAEKA